MWNGAEQSRTNHAGRGLLYVLGGVVIGAVVGFLTASRSGERTRRQIVRAAEDVRDQAVDLYDDVRDKVEGLRKGVARQIDAGKEFFDGRIGGYFTGLERPITSLSKKFGRN